MSEIALRTTERKLQKAKYLGWRPVGSTIVCCSDHMIRRKWLEIVCDLVAPYKRKGYTALPGYDSLVAAWTPQLREAWLEYDRPTKQYKLSRLLQDDAFPQFVWGEIIEPIGLLEDLPYAPEANVKVYDTWLWSELERKNYFVIVNEDADRQTVQAWQGTEERDADTGEVLPELGPDEVYGPTINLAVVWKGQVKYETDLGLSGDTLANIADKDKIVHPRFDKPVAKVKVKQPTIVDAKAVQ